MSGTSVDAVDAVAARWSDGRVDVIGAIEHPIPLTLRDQLLHMMDGQAVTLEKFYTLDAAVAELHVGAIDALLSTSCLDKADIRAVGFHGQTVYHAPRAHPGFTVQLGDPNLLAAKSGLAVVADVRRADIALGGEGAPLAPGLHTALFQHSTQSRAVLNLGGIANLTLLPCDGSPVQGFDTGPANALLDAWCGRQFNTRCDFNGEIAAQGTVHNEILARMLASPYFERQPPKSTGRDLFSLTWVDSLCHNTRISDRDMLATLVELTALSVAGALRQHSPDCERVLVAGGGRHNQTLMARLADHLDCPIEPTDAHGFNGDTLEALLMAWLARQRVLHAPSNVPSVTGASAPVSLGGLYLPPSSL